MLTTYVTFAYCVGSFFNYFFFWGGGGLDWIELEVWIIVCLLMLRWFGATSRFSLFYIYFLDGNVCQFLLLSVFLLLLLPSPLHTTAGCLNYFVDVLLIFDATSIVYMRVCFVISLKSF